MTRIKVVTVIPAYGRDYKSKAAAIADWHAGKDFQIYGSNSYINIADAMMYDVTSVTIRYHQMTRVVVMTEPYKEP